MAETKKIRSMKGLETKLDVLTGKLEGTLGISLDGEPKPLVAKVVTSDKNTPMIRNIIIGTEDPTPSIGSDGDIYLKYKA